jgi:hypothetical protein
MRGTLISVPWSAVVPTIIEDQGFVNRKAAYKSLSKVQKK